MKVTFVDLEWGVTQRNGIVDGSPYCGTNMLVSGGFRTKENGVLIQDEYLFINHADLPDIDKRAVHTQIQTILDNTDCLVAHNAKGDLTWLLESGFVYDREIYCTMIGEYVLARGQKPGLSLDDIAAARRCTRKGTDKIQSYLDRDVTFYNIPHKLVEEYGRLDVQVLEEIYNSQLEDCEKSPGLLKTRKLMNLVITPCITMERNGACIDRPSLDALELEYQTKLNELTKFIQTKIVEYMGATPLNVNSPEQLSQFIYSRKVIDKDLWAETFNIGTETRGSVSKKKRRTRMSAQGFYDAVVKHTRVLAKTTAQHCDTCKGKGRVEKYTTTGRLFKNLPRCGACGGAGYVLVPTKAVAGLKMVPLGPETAASGGFATGSTILESLALTAKLKNKIEEAKILEALVEISSISSHLTSSIAGIKKHVQADGILHSSLNQCVAATGRLSSSNPNQQNWPRANTFPLRRAIKSRFKDGTILEVDYAQLEYVCAVFLAKDKKGYQSVIDKIDRHKITAGVIGCSRQEAKPHTFKPLYGGSTGTEAEQAYYKAFMEEHEGIAEWHEYLKSCALKTGIIRLPTGREYYFPNARRLFNGYVTGTTQIVNYPVQGFATGDIVPYTGVKLNTMWDQTKELEQSKMFWTVHDSFLFDLHPNEKDFAIKKIDEVFRKMPEHIYSYWGIEFDLPLRYEFKAGPNWLELKDVAM